MVNNDVDYIVDRLSRNNETSRDALLGKSTVFTMQKCLFCLVKVPILKRKNAYFKRWHE